MKLDFLKFACVSILVTAVSSTFAAADGYLEYFDCWLEKSSSIEPSERARIGAGDNANVCGCFKVREKGGWKWRGDEPKQITKVWNIPKPKVTPCSGNSCDDAGAIQQCVDYIQSSNVSLADFKTGRALDGAVAFTYENDGWSNTPFGDYYEQRKDRADAIDCFFNIHGRPDADPDDKNHPENFTFSGMPKKLVPSAVGRFTDFSDVRCLDKNELTGFAFNGYRENLRHVDEKGLLQGEEIGYMNDPTYPVKQADKWGKVAWTANHKNGMREGVATFYKSSVMDNSNKTYYFKHLEVPFKQGFRDGTVRMLAENGFVMAEIPQKRNGIHGRMTVNNPFKKKKVTLTFNANQLEGFVDFGDFGGVYHQGLPNGLITFWAVKDTCYQWMQGESVCYTERLRKTQWGTYKMGKFKGVMECWNGMKGDAKLVCPELPADSIKYTPAGRDSIARLDSLAAAGDTAAIALIRAGKIKEQKEKVALAREKAAKSREAANQADLIAKQAEEEAAQAEKELALLENPAPAEPAAEEAQEEDAPSKDKKDKHKDKKSSKDKKATKPTKNKKR
ncbi:MAG: hypothetical protein MJY87_00120 [Fibrobacter sp.]|nr:hypothetical protein [Fibrobacter sp.]